MTDKNCPSCGYESDHRYDRGADVERYLCLNKDCRVKVFAVA